MHKLCYATSKYPDRDFTFGGVIISSGDVGYEGRQEKDRLNSTGNNHGSIEWINGKWYVFYHRHTHNSTYSRQACAEPIVIDENGFIPQVEVTSCGLNGGPLKAEGEYPAVIACNLTDGKMEHQGNGFHKTGKPCITHQGDERFITGIGNNVLAGFKYFAFSGPVDLGIKTRGTGKGQFLVSTELGGDPVGEIDVVPSGDWTAGKTPLELQGKKALYFTFKGKGKVDFLSLSFAKK
jgi:hypothetical protein